MNELIINEDISIPKNVSRDKYSKFGIEFPIQEDHKYVLIREGQQINLVDKPKVFERGKIYCMLGDVLMDVTESRSVIFVRSEN